MLCDDKALASVPLCRIVPDPCNPRVFVAGRLTRMKKIEYAKAVGLKGGFRKGLAGRQIGLVILIE